jgi:hypothetical protein
MGFALIMHCDAATLRYDAAVLRSAPAEHPFPGRPFYINRSCMSDIVLTLWYHLYMMIHELLEAIYIVSLLVVVWFILDVAWDALTEDEGK